MIRIVIVLVCLLMFALDAFCDSLINRIIANPPPASVVADAKALFVKIKKVNTKAEDATYKDYSVMAYDLKAEYDVFKSEQRDFPELVELLGISVKHFQDASDYWYNYIKGDRSLVGYDAVKEYKIRNGRAMQESFKAASSSVEDLDNLFYELKKQKNVIKDDHSK